MPRKDGTGPAGEGPMTGRRMGNCTQQKETREAGRGFGRNRRANGRSGGNGRRNRRRSMFYASGLTASERETLTNLEPETMDHADELQALKEEAAVMATRMQDIERRIEELQSETGDQ